MTNKHLPYLQALGIQTWEPRKTPLQNALDRSSPSIELSRQPSSWDELEEVTRSCVLCNLAKTRTKVVFGCGDRRAKLLIIGEGPGANEDKQGEPFVGRAGLLLNEILLAIGLARDKVYIANVVKCRPPDNRDPLPNEVAMCTPYLKKQIELLQPKLIVAVGRVAGQCLLSSNETLGKLRNSLHNYGVTKTPLLITYHPAYLLRSPSEKSKAYHDWLKVKEMLFGR